MVSPVKIWRNQKKLKELLNQHGQIVTWTIIRVPPGNFTSQAPYPVVLVKFNNGKTITAQLVDWENSDLLIGKLVTTVIRKIADFGTEEVIPYGIKVKPVK